MYKNQSVIVFIIFAIIVCMHIGINYFIVPVNEEKSQNSDEWIPSTYRVEYNAQFQNAPITSYDIVGDLVYFSYSEGVSAVEAYDLNGKYVFSIIFANEQKGSILIRGEEDRLYISTKNNDVFVFKCDTLIEILSKEAADAAGYHYKWFSENKSGIKFVGTHLRRFDSKGDIYVDVPVPARIVWNYYKNYSVFVAIGLVAVGLLIQRVTGKQVFGRRKDRGQGGNPLVT